MGGEGANAVGSVKAAAANANADTDADARRVVSFPVLGEIERGGHNDGHRGRVRQSEKNKKGRD